MRCKFNLVFISSLACTQLEAGSAANGAPEQVMWISPAHVVRHIVGRIDGVYHQRPLLRQLDLNCTVPQPPDAFVLRAPEYAHSLRSTGFMA